VRERRKSPFNACKQQELQKQKQKKREKWRLEGGERVQADHRPGVSFSWRRIWKEAVGVCRLPVEKRVFRKGVARDN